MRASMKRRTRRNFRHIDVVNWKIFTGSQKFFMKNGKSLLEERISLFHGKVNPIRCFSVDELNAMITGLNDDLPDEYKWFNGDFDGRPVLIKVRKNDRIGCLFREIAVAAQMSTHKNALKLLGCCLETEHPILVYDNNNVHYECLCDRMFVDENQGKEILGWDDRLRIAWEISHSVAYLHSAFPRPIVHRDLKPSNVLLDKDNSAKLSGFDISISLPEGENYLQLDHIAGTWGYIAPECLKQAKLTEKSDVYSFGILFLGLIAGERPTDLLRKIIAEYSNNELDSFDVESCSSSTDDELCKFDDEAYITDDEPHYAELHGTNDELNSPGCEKVRSWLEIQVSKYLESEDMHINRIFDHAVKNETESPNEYILRQQFNESTQLVLRCIAEDADSRPTMEEVASKLKNIINASFESHVLTASNCLTRESEELSNEVEPEEPLSTGQATSPINQEHEMGYDGSSKSSMVKGRILAAAIPLLLFYLVFVPLVSHFYR